MKDKVVGVSRKVTMDYQLSIRARSTLNGEESEKSPHVQLAYS